MCEGVGYVCRVCVTVLGYVCGWSGMLTVSGMCDDGRVCVSGMCDDSRVRVTVVGYV